MSSDSIRRNHLSSGGQSATRSSLKRPRQVQIPASASSANNEDELNRLTPRQRQPGSERKKHECEMLRMLRSTVLELAKLSLEDYKWRSSIFKEEEASRMMEESMALIRGDEPVYVRPMDADETKIGPLGRLEKMMVTWLYNVINEEARRAERIVDSNGELVRPIEAEEPGPLGWAEKQVVDWLEKIKHSEQERARTRTLRPMDLDETVRGPLGEMEMNTVNMIQEIQESEKLRMEQSKNRGYEIVRPIDVPGPLGEFEMAVSEVFEAEKMRAAEREITNKFVRPMQANFRGPLGDVEQQAVEAIDKVRAEESERLRNIQRAMEDNRPMETDRNSILGMAETFFVGLARAPAMLASVFDRVKELLESEKLDKGDVERLRDASDDTRRNGSGDKEP